MVRSGLCIGCGICVTQAASSGAHMELDLHGQLEPTGPIEWYRHRSEDIAALCPFSPAAADETRWH